jgi:hypothetical protein
MEVVKVKVEGVSVKSRMPSPPAFLTVLSPQTQIAVDHGAGKPSRAQW